MRKRKKRGIVLGFDYYSAFLATLVNEYSSEWELRCFPSTRIGTLRALLDGMRADAIISFGGPGPNAALAELAAARGIPVIVIWAGSDVTTAAASPHLLELIKQYQFVNLSDGPWLIDELRSLGIDARYCPVTAIEPAVTIAPLPKDFSVLTYLPEPRRTFYGEDRVYAIARQLPDVPFVVVGKGSANPAAPPNVHFSGYVGGMPSRIDDTVVLLRLPEHDGKSMLVLETLARARHVIWTHPFPGVHDVVDDAQAAEILKRMQAMHRDGTLPLNLAGYAHVRKHFRRADLACAFIAELNRTLPGKQTDTQRVAISGHHLFVAQQARLLETSSTGWAASVLRTGARLEVLTAMFTLFRCKVWYSIGAPISDRWLLLLARMLRKPRVIHWVGSDISALRGNRSLRRHCTGRNVQNLTEVSWTQDELRNFGVPSTIAPLAAQLPTSKLRPLPSQFTVLFYLPKSRLEFYGKRECERLIREFADRGVRFLIVGGGTCDIPRGANVEILGWCHSLSEAYARSTALVRFTEHDGLSLMVLEALANARYVAWSKPFPYTLHAQSYPSLVRAISELLERHERGELAPNFQGADYVRSTYEARRCIERITDHFNQAESLA